MEILRQLYYRFMLLPAADGILFYGGIFFFLFAYRFFRRERWRAILGRSLEYHRFHFTQMYNDKSVNEKARELYQALLWAVNKQLKDDLARSNGRGGAVLWRSFLGDKTCVNTCGTVFYETAKNYRYVGETLARLNDTLISTFYRILFVESFLSPVALIYMDMRLLISMITRPSSGTGRLYREMLREMRSAGRNK